MTTQDPIPDPEIERIQKELEDVTDLAKRTMADFQNYKRRTEQEQAEMKVYANVRFLEAIFPVLDNFKRAFAQVPPELAENEWVKGVTQIEKSFFETLKMMGLEPIEETGIPVDPHRHEVLMEGEGPAGQVVQIFERGYSFNGKVIRPAKVLVGKA